MDSITISYNQANAEKITAPKNRALEIFKETHYLSVGNWVLRDTGHTHGKYVLEYKGAHWNRYDDMEFAVEMFVEFAASQIMDKKPVSQEKRKMQLEETIKEGMGVE